MAALYFPITELPEGYVHNSDSLKQTNMIVSGYTAQGTLFLEHSARQVFAVGDGEVPGASELPQKKKKKIVKQSIMSVYVPRFPISWLANISSEVRTILEQYLFSLPRAALPKDSVQLADFYNGNPFELINQAKVPTCAELSKNPVDMLTKLLTIRKHNEFASYYDIHVILVFAVQTPFTVQTIDQMRTFFAHTPLLQPDALLSSVAPKDMQQKCIDILSSDMLFRPLIVSLTRIMTDTERVKRSGDIISYLTIVYTNYRKILRISLFCDTLSILLSPIEGEPLAVQQYIIVMAYICFIIKSNDELNSVFVSELSRAGVAKKIMTIIDALEELPAEKNKHSLLSLVRKLVFILAHMRYSEHGARNLPTGQYLADAKEHLFKLSAKLDVPLINKPLDGNEQSSENSDDSANNVGDTDNSSFGDKSAMPEDASTLRQIITALYDKKPPPLATFTSLFS